MNKALKNNPEYFVWLRELKTKIRAAQIKAALKVNSELIQFYWELGEDIVSKQANASWGDGFLKQLSRDLEEEFPNMKGFSERNLRAIRQWYLFYFTDKALLNKGDTSIRKQPVSELTKQLVLQLSHSLWGQE